MLSGTAELAMATLAMGAVFVHQRGRELSTCQVRTALRLRQLAAMRDIGILS